MRKKKVIGPPLPTCADGSRFTQRFMYFLDPERFVIWKANALPFFDAQQRTAFLIDEVLFLEGEHTQRVINYAVFLFSMGVSRK